MTTTKPLPNSAASQSPNAMKPPRAPSPLTTRPPADTPDPALAPLLAEPFVRAWAARPADGPTSSAVRSRLLDRARAGHAAEAAMFTVRRQRQAPMPMAPGVSTQELYRAPAGRPLRPGEPLRSCLIELQPHARLDASQAGDDTPRHREWLVLRGGLQLGGETLGERDYHVAPADARSPALVAGAEGALVFLRESDVAARPGDAPHTVLDAAAGWPDYAPGIQRRVLWQRDGQAALLYLAQPGALVPHHGHGHDEECLMVQGELFLDDLLLQPGDYQLAPAGTGHRVTETDTGVILYAHGDVDLQFIA